MRAGSNRHCRSRYSGRGAAGGAPVAVDEQEELAALQDAAARCSSCRTRWCLAIILPPKCSASCWARSISACAAVDPSVYDDDRNVDAALIYAMSGGNPETLEYPRRPRCQRLLRQSRQRRVAEISERQGDLLGRQDALSKRRTNTKDKKIGPYLALVGGNVTIAKSPMEALKLYDQSAPQCTRHHRRGGGACAARCRSASKPGWWTRGSLIRSAMFAASCIRPMRASSPIFSSS